MTKTNRTHAYTYVYTHARAHTLPRRLARTTYLLHQDLAFMLPFNRGPVLVEKGEQLRAAVVAVEQLAQNLGAFMDQIVRSKPSGAKGTYLKSVTVSSTMGPGVVIDPNLYRKA